MTTSSSLSNIHLMVVSPASAILILLQFGLVTSFQQNPAQCTLSGISHSALHRPTTCLWSASIVEDTTDLIAEEEQADYDWDAQFEKLLLFKEEYGHCNFPQNAPAELNKKYPTLARFCHDQVRECGEVKTWNQRNGMTLQLFDRRVCCRRLEGIGFEADVSQVYWYEKYHELIQYHSEHGHFDVGKEENISLYRWILTQRQNKKGTLGQESLSESQINLLDRLEFPWKGPKNEWMKRYNELIAFRSKHGHLQVVRKLNPALYIWIHNQRSRYRNDSLSEQKVKQLDDIGFNWKANLGETLWDAKYRKLVEFKTKHGHCWIPLENRSLYAWAAQQRRQRPGKTNSLAPLSKKRVQLLEDIDFPWQSDRHEFSWLAKYNELVLFKKTHGHSRPRQSTHKNVYGWLRNQRRKRDKGLLSTEQIEKLDKIGFPWKQQSRKWITMRNALSDYCNEHGHIRVSEEENPDLYEWMTTERKRYHGIVKKPAITERQIEMLEEFHFCWSIDWKEQMWHKMYTEMAESCKKHGHTQVHEKDNPSLYNWIQTQGKRYNQLKGHKPLSSMELELLEQIDFAFLENQPRMAWKMMYAELKTYREENDGRFPEYKDCPDLNRWMRQQRKRKRSAYGFVALSDEQEFLLGSIGFSMFPKMDCLSAWYERYDELVEFWEYHGHFLISRSDDPILSDWITQQRRRHNKETIWGGPLSKSQIYLMERIGFPWMSNRHEIEWQVRYDELVQFLEVEGHFPGITEHPVLHTWVQRQRSRYKAKVGSGIADHQIQQLDKIGFRWSPREDDRKSP
ncbi:MAG: hypothetical protein SGBAC_008929 [Bacillariaceae sp.]